MAIRRRPVQDSKVLRRRRARRLRSAFLRLRREAMKPVGVFDASHFEWMLRSGNPDDAHYYLRCFLHRVPALERVTSPQYYDLVHHVGVFKTLAKVVAGGQEGAALAKSFANPSESKLRSPASARLHKMIAVMHASRTRASKHWEQILKPQAMDVIMDLVARCPELQGEPRLPRERTLLCEELHGMPECPGCYWKESIRASAEAIFREFLRKRVHTTLGRKRSVCSRIASFQSSAQHMKAEKNSLQPGDHEAEEDRGPASCSVELNTKVNKLLQITSIFPGSQWEIWRELQRKQGVYQV